MYICTFKNESYIFEILSQLLINTKFFSGILFFMFILLFALIMYVLLHFILVFLI